MTDLAATDWGAHFDMAQGRRDWPNEELVRFCAGLGREFGSGSRVLDAGCGDGSNLRLLVESGADVVGIDGCYDAIWWAKRMEADALILGDVRRLPFLDGTFDLVVDCMVSQHLSWAEHAPLYAEYRRVLRPGGRLWIYHLDSDTKSRRLGVRGNGDVERLGLFPMVRGFCLPPWWMLSVLCRKIGFDVVRRGLRRIYPDGQVASYTIIEGRTT